MEAIVVPLLSSVGATGAASAVSAVSSSGIFSALGAISSVMSGFSQYQAGQAQQEMYQQQARYAAIRAESEALKYKAQGVAVMDKTLMTVAAIRARGAAGGIDPFAGSAGALSTYAFGKGFGEVNLTEDSAEMARIGGTIQSGIYTGMGNQAAFAGVSRFVGSTFQGIHSASLIGGPPSGGGYTSYGGFSSQSALDAYLANPVLPPLR